MMSGAEWPVKLSECCWRSPSCCCLRSHQGRAPRRKYLTDHLLSLLVFGGAAAEFVLLAEFGTSTFFLLTLLALVDFLSGIALRTRRRAVAVAAPAPSKGAAKAGRRARTRTPAPAPAAPPAAFRQPFRLRQPLRPRQPCRRQRRSPSLSCWIALNRNRCTPPTRPMRPRPRRKSRSSRDAVSRISSPGIQPGSGRCRPSGQAGYASALS